MKAPTSWSGNALHGQLQERNQRKRPPAKAKSFDIMRTRIVFPTVVAATLICASLSYGQAGAVPAATPIDATLYTRYHTDPNQTIIDWNVCGSLPGSSGCYGSGSLGPFARIGGVMEGEPKTDLIANTVTRPIYFVDIASGPNQNEVVLYVYTKVDTITTDSDTVTVTLSQTISLPLVGGIASGSNYTSMAANKQFLFFGTRLNPEAVEINKRTFSVTQLGGFSPPINIFGITANDYGYVTLSFGKFNTSNTAFIVVGPDGSDVEDGDGSQFMLNTDQAIKLTATSAGIQRPAHAGISDPLRGRRFRGRHDQAGAVPAATPIDATLYTRYNTDPNQTIIDWNVCGSLPNSSGCYGSGTLGPFGRVGALLEGEPTTNRPANTVTRAIYVLEPASGPNQNEVVLYVYTKVDTITTDSDTVTVTLSQTISLPLVGGFGGGPNQTSMAANKQFLFIGTSRSPEAVEINKRTFTVTQFGGF